MRKQYSCDPGEAFGWLAAGDIQPPSIFSTCPLLTSYFIRYQLWALLYVMYQSYQASQHPYQTRYSSNSSAINWLNETHSTDSKSYILGSAAAQQPRRGSRNNVQNTLTKCLVVITIIPPPNFRFQLKSSKASVLQVIIVLTQEMTPALHCNSSC